MADMATWRLKLIWGNGWVLQNPPTKIIKGSQGSQKIINDPSYWQLYEESNGCGVHWSPAFQTQQSPKWKTIAGMRMNAEVVFLMVGITAVYCDVQGLAGAKSNSLAEKVGRERESQPEREREGRRKR